MDPAHGRIWHVGAIAILLLVPFVFFWQMTIEGREPSAPDTEAVRPLGVWATQARAEMGHTPQWCPAIFSGMPSYGSFIHTPSSPFDVTSWLRSLFPGSRGMRYFVALAIGAIAMYLLLVRWRMGPIGALTGAFSFAMMPYMLGLVAAGHSTKLQTLYLAPLVFLAIQVLLDQRTLIAAAFVAGAVALQFWNNHPQISYYTLMLGVLYFVLTLVFDRPERWRGRAWVTGVALAGLALLLAAGLVLEPYGAVLEYAPHSIRGGTGELAGAAAGGGSGWAYATAWSYPVVGVIEFLFPGWFGLEGQTYWGNLPFTQSTHYVGITVLLLAILGLASWRARRRWILLALSGFVLLVGFGRNLPILYWPIYHLLPMFNRFRVPSMIYALLPLLLGGLVGAGVDRIVEGTVGRRPGAAAKREGPRPATRSPRRGRRDGSQSGPDRWLVFALVATGALVLWLLGGSAIAQGMRGGGAFLKEGELGRVPSGLLGELTHQRIAIFRQSVAIGLFLLATGAWLILGRRFGVLRGTLAGGLLFVWVAADLWVIDRKFYDPRPRSETEAVLAPDGVVRFLQGQDPPFRIAPFYGSEFRSNRYAAFGLETIGGYQPAGLRSYDDLVRSRAIFAPGVLSMLNVTYVLADESLTDVGWPLAARVVGAAGDTVYIHENPRAMPRAWFVGEARTVGDAREMLALLAKPDFDPGRTACFYRNETGLIPERLSPGEIRPFDELRPLERQGQSLGFRHSSEEIALPVRVAGPQPGLLILSEIYYRPGWRAEIDGKRASILRANHVLRAVVVPPGEHQVRLTAFSPALERGVRISRISGILVLGLLAGGLVSRWRGRRRARSAAQP
jgi:hypothetical protein